MSDDKVIPFGPRTIKDEWLEPHISNDVKCLVCRHEWKGVAPVGVTWMECPACGLQTGRFVGPVSRAGLYFQCKCGNDLFSIDEDSHANCGVCGRVHEF